MPAKHKSVLSAARVWIVLSVYVEGDSRGTRGMHVL